MYLETSLTTPINQVLPIIQDSIMNRTLYHGITTYKNPFDAWIYQEIIFERKPDLIIEIGNYFGGSTLFLAHICDALGRGQILAIDLDQSKIFPAVRKHPKISFLEGDACSLFPQVQTLTKGFGEILIIDDSAHTYVTTLSILKTYSSLIKPGGYFIVEDGICHHGLDIGPSPGPFEACEKFIANNTNFEIDREREKFILTWNPKGYLRRIR